MVLILPIIRMQGKKVINFIISHLFILKGTEAALVALQLYLQMHQVLLIIQINLVIMEVTILSHLKLNLNVSLPIFIH